MSSNYQKVANHYNSLKESGLKARNQSDILYLRNFNNWIKSILIQTYISKTSDNYKEIHILDLASGKGGDQLKWAKAQVSHVTFLDIAELSIKQSEERYNRGRFLYTADFIVADFTQVDFKSIIARNYHIISCQFALHYSFESYQQAYLTFKNISNSLCKSGYFIGTTVNAYELKKRLNISKDRSFGNDYYKVTFPHDASENDLNSLFGSKYDFYLKGAVNCPEFIVYPPLMDKIAQEHNLKLINRSSFPDFFETHISSDHGRSLISRIRPLQEILIKDINNLPENEYPNAKDFTNQSTYSKVHTISQSEWEIIQLYDVFVYQKV